MNTNCILGNVYTTNCTVNTQSTNVTCTGPNNFQKNYFCKYCWQLNEGVHYTCNYAPQSQTPCQSGQDTLVVNCVTNWNVLCLGNRSFQKISTCNYSTGLTWSSSFLYSLL